MAHFEKCISSETIFEGKILRLRRDTVELEDHSLATREVIDHPGGVAVLALDSDDKFYFVRQFRYPFGKELLELPAGKLEAGEEPALCGIRELREECGRVAEVFLPLGKFYPTCAYDTEVIHLFFARNLKIAEQSLDLGEFLTVEKIPVEKALRLVLDGEILDGKTRMALLTYHVLHQEGKL